MLVGSYSSNVHGIPRSTKDADFVIDLPNDAAMGAVARALAPDLCVDPHHQERVKRRVARSLEGSTVWYQSAEDVIIQKLR